MASLADTRVETTSTEFDKKEVPTYQQVSESDKENTPQKIMKTSRNGTPILTASNGRLKGQFKIMSDDEIASMGKLKESVGKKVKTAKRRSLAPLQQSVEGKDILTGYGRGTQTLKDALLNKKNSKIAEESKHQLHNDNINDLSSPILTNIKVNERKIEDSLVEDALALMKSTETIGEGYWKSLAEERRVALEETLDENEKLYDEIEKLRKENEDMKVSLSELECYKMLYLSLQDKLSTDDNGETTDE